MKIVIKIGKKRIDDVEYIKDSKRAWGLMFAKKGKILLEADWEGIWATSIHTFFCNPLLIVWINSKREVVDVKKAKPWHIYLPKKPSKYVFETTDLNTKIKIGDKLLFLSHNQNLL